MKNAPQPKQSGAVMVFAMMLMGAGIFVLAAVLQLAATQGISGEAEWVALDRRVTTGNSRALAREYMLSRIFRGAVPADGSPNVTFSNASGGFLIRPAGSAQTNYWAALSTTNTDVVLNINPFNLLERGGFYREVFTADLTEDASRTVDWSFALRTRSPVAAGYSFAQHRPANNSLASMASPPYIDMRSTTAQFVGFYGLPRMPVASVTNTMTRGSGDTNGYQGYLDVREGASIYGMFTNYWYEPREPTNQTPQTLQVVLNLSGADAIFTDSPVVRFDADDNSASYTNGTNVYNLPVKAVVLSGTSVVDQKPLHVVVPESNTNITTLVLSNDNIRLVYFYRQKAVNDGIPFDVASVNASAWRLGITMSQCNIQFDVGDLEFTGGLRTDGSINFQGGSANFIPETDPGGLDFIADRMMWLEDYRAQQ